MFFALSACAAEDDGTPPSEQVTAPEWSPVWAFAREGDAIYAARTTRLDRIDARTGAVTRVAGPEWATCPAHPREHWLTGAFDWGYPRLAVNGSKLFLVQEYCGLWSFDTATGDRRMLVDVASGRYGVQVEWNGKEGPEWVRAYGMAIAAEGDGLVGCFRISNYDETEKQVYDRLELWSIAADGTPRDRLATLATAPLSQFDENYCTAVIPDSTAILVGTQRAIRRYDRATRRLSTVVSDLEYGSHSIAQDETSVFYIGKEAEIVRVPRDGSPPVTLAPAVRPTDPSRAVLTLVGDTLFYNEGYSLRRMPTLGGASSVFAPGTLEDWVVPTTLGVSDGAIYFQKAVRVPKHQDLEPDTGETVDVEWLHSIRRARP